MLLLVVGSGVYFIGGKFQSAKIASADSQLRGDWQPFTPERLQTELEHGRTVFVDFTAAWCVTCQVNKRLVLGRDDVLAAFRARGIALVRADWTRRDDEITRALAALGRNGVPVYVLYKPGRAPVLLPEVLTRERVLAALDE